MDNKMKRIIILLGALLCSGSVFSQVGINTVSPGSILTVNGSFSSNYREVTTNTVLSISDSYVAYEGSSDATLTLPAAISGNGNFKGRIYGIKNSSSSVVTIMANGTEQIDGATDVSAVTLPPGYYVELISKGTTTGTTWELSMFVNTTIPTITNVVSINSATPQSALATATTNVNSNTYTTIPGSSASFVLSGGKPIFLNYALGLDDLTTGSSVPPYFRCEIYIDGVATGLFQIVQEVSVGSQLQFNLSGVRSLSAGPHTIDVRIIRWFNNGIGASTNQNFGVLSQVLDAVYIN